jgi:hypothetical protein
MRFGKKVPGTFLAALLMPVLASAQYAGSSYNLSELCVNPAAATLRKAGSFTTGYQFKNSHSEVNQSRSDSAEIPWKETVEIHKAEVFVSHVGKLFAPEAYFAYENVKKTTSVDEGQGGNQAHANAAAFFNNMINLGIRVTDKFSLGIKYYSPIFRYKYDNTYVYSDGNTFRDASDYSGSFTGLGYGFTYKTNSKWTLAGLLISSSQSVKGSSTYTDINGQASSSSQTGAVEFVTKGIGLGYSSSNSRRNAWRTEVAYAVTEFPASVFAKEGEQFFAAFEVAADVFIVGLSVRMIKNSFVDSMRLVETFIDPPPNDDKYSTKFNYFIRLNSSRGHSFGADGSYWVSQGKKSFLGTEQDAITKSYSVGLSYSYLF